MIPGEVPLNIDHQTLSNPRRSLPLQFEQLILRIPYCTASKSAKRQTKYDYEKANHVLKSPTFSCQCSSWPFLYCQTIIVFTAITGETQS